MLDFRQKLSIMKAKRGIFADLRYLYLIYSFHGILTDTDFAVSTIDFIPQNSPAR